MSRDDDTKEVQHYEITKREHENALPLLPPNMGPQRYEVVVRQVDGDHIKEAAGVDSDDDGALEKALEKLRNDES